MTFERMRADETNNSGQWLVRHISHNMLIWKFKVTQKSWRILGTIIYVTCKFYCCHLAKFLLWLCQTSHVPILSPSSDSAYFYYVFQSRWQMSIYFTFKYWAVHTIDSIRKLNFSWDKVLVCSPGWPQVYHLSLSLLSARILVCTVTPCFQICFPLEGLSV